MKSKILVCVLLGLSSGPALAESISVLEVALSAPVPNRKYTKEFTTLKLGGNLNRNKDIVEFEVNVGMNDETIKVPFSAIQNKTYDLVVSGITLGTIQGIKMSKSGEGLVRLQAKSKFLAKGFPGSLEVQLRRMGVDKEWAIFHKGKILKSAEFVMSKNPSDMNMVALMMKPPQLTNMKTEVVGCNTDDLVALVAKYQSPEILKSAGCDTKILSSETLTEIFAETFRTDSHYKNFYGGENDAKDQQAAIPAKLENLKKFGISLSQLDPQINDITYGLIASGDIVNLDFLLGLGFRPGKSSYSNAVRELLQYDTKTEKLVKSSTAGNIFEKVRTLTVQKT